MVKRRFEIDAHTLPNLPGMMLVTVEALKELGGSATIHELDEKVIELEGVTEHEQTFVMAGNENRTRVNYYLAWARTYLKRGDALANSSRGVWALTATGSAIAATNETKAIHDRVTAEEREKARLKRKAAKAEEPDVLEPGDDTPEQEEDWKSSLLRCWAKCRRMRLSGYRRGSCAKRIHQSRCTWKVGRRRNRRRRRAAREPCFVSDLLPVQALERKRRRQGIRNFAVPCRAVQTRACSSPRVTSPAKLPTRPPAPARLPSTSSTVTASATCSRKIALAWKPR